MGLRLLLAGCLAALSGLVVPAAQADKASTVTIDISDAAASGDLSIFKKDGIRFAEFLIVDGVKIPSGYGLIETQGDTVLHVSLTLGRPLVATKTMTVTQTGTGLPGDEFRTPVGFFQITVSDLPSQAKSFSMTGTAEFGVNWISYTYGDAA